MGCDNAWAKPAIYPIEAAQLPSQFLFVLAKGE